MTVNCVALFAFDIPPTSIMACLRSILGHSPNRTSHAATSPGSTPSRLSAMMLLGTFSRTVQNTKRTILVPQLAGGPGQYNAMAAVPPSSHMVGVRRPSQRII